MAGTLALCVERVKRGTARSFLTVLGIVPGVGSFICAVGIGNAGSAKVEAQLRSLGDNMIWVEAGSRNRNGVRNGARPPHAHADPRAAPPRTSQTHITWVMFDHNLLWVRS